VTVVFLGDDYVAGALALAHSLRMAGTRAELVVLVSADVSESARAHLRLLFDAVHEVPLLRGRAIHKEWKRFTQGLQNGQKMYDWIDYSFTKMHVLSLTQYDKVALLDADMLCQSPPDELWKVHAPAGVCSLLPDDSPTGQELHHGQRLTMAQVGRSVERSYGIRGCLALLKPNRAHFELLQRVLEKYGGYGERRYFIGADEKLLTDLYLDQWSHIHLRFGVASWKSSPRELGSKPAVFLHFVTEKPWRPAPINVKGGSGKQPWPDLFIFHKAVRSLLDQFPQLTPYFQLHLDFMQPFIDTRVQPLVAAVHSNGAVAAAAASTSSSRRHSHSRSRSSSRARDLRHPSPTGLERDGRRRRSRSADRRASSAATLSAAAEQ
jgi:hypothetical protein